MAGFSWLAIGQATTAVAVRQRREQAGWGRKGSAGIEMAHCCREIAHGQELHLKHVVGAVRGLADCCDLVGEEDALQAQQPRHPSFNPRLAKER
jgi:hypothetical protein